NDSGPPGTPARPIATAENAGREHRRPQVLSGETRSACRRPFEAARWLLPSAIQDVSWFGEARGGRNGPVRSNRPPKASAPPCACHRNRYPVIWRRFPGIWRRIGYIVSRRLPSVNGDLTWEDQSQVI